MSFPLALLESVKTCPFTEADSDRVQSLRKTSPLPIDFYLAGLAEQYPPEDFEATQQLVSDVEKSDELSQQEQAVVIYYVFLSFETLEPAQGLAAYYASELALPISWQNYAKSLWFIEHKQNEKALANLGTIPAPHAVVKSIIAQLRPNSKILCLFFETHRQYLDHDNLEVYIAALCDEHLYFTVFEILRANTLRQEDILDYLGKHIAEQTDGPALVAFVSLPFSQQEWRIIQSWLDKQPVDSPAAKLSLTRALHLGDLPTIQQFKDIPEYSLLTKSYDDY